MSQQFFLTLPSNSSLQFFPSNAATEFSTILPKRYSLEGKWEVGLSEIILPNSWYNIEQDDIITITCTANSGKIKNNFPEGYMDRILSALRMRSYTKRIRLFPGYYPTIRKLVEHINDRIKHFFEESIHEWHDFRPGPSHEGIFIHDDYFPKLLYSDPKKKVNIVLHGMMTLVMSPNLADILGYDSVQIKNDSYENHMHYKSDNLVNLNIGRSIAYVYCDILEHVTVGDVMAPLLKIVDINTDVTNENSAILRRSYDRPLYVPLRMHDFDTVEISLKDEYGRKLSIPNGRSILTLHFRQSKETYFS